MDRVRRHVARRRLHRLLDRFKDVPLSFRSGLVISFLFCVSRPKEAIDDVVCRF